MLSEFPYHKMAFNPRAICLTIAPDQYSVLLSQRRRWINSTVHNLMELLWVDQMCGFCCFSMRFVVFIDLFATIVQPAGIVYIMYLIIKISYEYITNVPDRQIPVIALYLLLAVYGMQMIIFLIKREFQHIGWMIIYILAMPIFGFVLPVYAFWNMDDFSWGSTRGVVGENKQMMSDLEYDENEIPLKTWKQHCLEVYEYSMDTSSVKSKGIKQRKTYIHEQEEHEIVGDYEIYMEIQRIMQRGIVNKKEIRIELSVLYGMEMSHKKEYINNCIAKILKENDL
eukprot:NODE_253_length_12805_cov_0.273413.p3 type:complete len:283 gc:universal NODE_253_length_12805_cov_0.273413:3493-2645(-)